jgi:hypothetical protein
MDYTINLTATEDAALSYISMSQDNWIQNVVHERCRIAIDEIVDITVQKCLANNVQLPGTKDAIVALAFERGWVKTAPQRQAEYEAQLAARRAGEQP